MTSRIDRRALFARLQDDATVPLSGDDKGRPLLLNLLGPPTHRLYWQLAMPWPKDIESMVHETRVSARRLEEAVALLGPSLRDNLSARARRRARALRHALGASREADVVRRDLQRLAGQEGVQAIDALHGQGRRALDRAMAAYPVERLLRHGMDVLSLCASATRKVPLRRLASRHLYARCHRASLLMPTIDQPKATAQHHHLRIRLKRLRYTVELLAQPFAAVLAVDELLADLKALQDALGAINDAEDMATYLDRADVKNASKLRSAVERERAERYAQARDLVHARAWRTLGALRRAAGHIGPLPA